MNKSKKTVIGLIIASALASGGIVIEDTYNKDIDLMGKMYSGAEYRAVRKGVADKASKNAFNEYEEIQLYVELLAKEKDKCGARIYEFSSKQDLRKMLKRFDEEGCPKIIIKK